MSHHQVDDAEYMADKYEMEDVDDDMDEEFRGREMGGSDSDVDEYDYLASAGFVSASALGMACGPALTFLLQTQFKLFNITFNENTLPGWVMALAWLIYLLWLWISFKEPSSYEAEDSVASQDAKTAG